MKILVCGSRTWRDVGAIRARLLLLPPGTIIIHGGARGADNLAGEVALQLAMYVHIYPADWGKEGRSAGIKRNIRMLDAKPDKVIAFWDGESAGTRHTINEAKRRKIPVEVVVETKKEI